MFMYGCKSHECIARCISWIAYASCARPMPSARTTMHTTLRDIASGRLKRNVCIITNVGLQIAITGMRQTIRTFGMYTPSIAG